MLPACVHMWESTRTNGEGATVGYFSSNSKQEQNIQLIKESGGKFNSIRQLYELLNDVGWCEMSVFSKQQWDSNNKCNGQCNATVLIVQEYFGGEIIQYPNPTPNKKNHYFNRINGVDIDLTADQFNPRLNEYHKCDILYRLGRSSFCYEKSACICKLQMGLNG